jgi:plastocyanin
MSIFKIQIKAGKPATYAPSPIKVFVNDSVYWYNGDPKEAHWPAPSTADPKGFLQYQIAPNSSSNQLSFPKPKTISYICINHKGETGTIIVKSAKKKGAYGHKTKKGAYGGKTKKGAYGKTAKKR